MYRCIPVLLIAACTSTTDSDDTDAPISAVDTALCTVLDAVSPEPIQATPELNDAPTAYLHDEAKRIQLAGDSAPFGGFVRIDAGFDGTHAFGLSGVADVIVYTDVGSALPEASGVATAGCDSLAHRVQYDLTVGVYWLYIESVATELTVATAPGS